MKSIPRLTEKEEKEVDALLQHGEHSGELSSLLLAMRADAPVAPSANLRDHIMDALPGPAPERQWRGRFLRLAAAIAVLLFVGLLSILLPQNQSVAPVRATSNVKPAEAALNWIASTQEPDGHWNAVRWGGASGQDAGITALATWALLKGGNDGHTQAVENALHWLADTGVRQALARERDDAALVGIVLLEAAKDQWPELVEPARLLASRFTARTFTQVAYGSENTRRVLPESNVWSAMFLRRAQDAGLVSTPLARQLFARLCACDADSPAASTPAAALCQTMATRGQALNPWAGRWAFLSKSSPTDYISAYFLSSLVHGTEMQENVAQNIYRSLLAQQAEEGELRGSFAPTGKWASVGGTVMSTSLATLILLAGQ